MPEPVNSYWDLIDPVWDSIDIDSPEAFLASSITVPEPALFLYASHFCQSEVCNGGFRQFFWNSTGVLAPEAAAGFSAVGMTELASVVTAASERLGLPYPRDRRERWNALLKLAGHSKAELEKIFGNAENEYQAFREALKAVEFDSLEANFYKRVNDEQGGFEEAASRYAQRMAGSI